MKEIFCTMENLFVTTTGMIMVLECSAEAWDILVEELQQTQDMDK